jgi:ATP-dependent DNA helicase RecQ
MQVLRKVQGTAIIYVRSRKATQDLSRWLNKQGIKSTFYNAGLTHEERSGRQQEWISNQMRVMVSTNAFGMGINKADVRTVIHMDLPENLEAYYQEAGRAGRDGNRAFAVLIFHDADVLALDHKIQQSQPGIEYLKKIYQALANYYQLAVGSSEGESFDFELEEFCKRFNLKSSAVYPALKKLEETGLIQLSESFYRPSRLHFSIDKKKLYDFQVANEKYDPLIKALLRLYGGELFTEFIGISESQIGKALKLNAKRIADDLLKLSKLHLLNYEPASDMPQVTFILSRQDVDHLPIDITRLEGRRKLILEKKDSMIAYVTQSHRCRMEVIQEYFDEEALIPCGICDVCIEKRKKENQTALKDYKDQIIYLLKQKSLSAEELETAVSPHDQELFVEVLREMVDSAEIVYDDFWMLHSK